MATSKKIFSIPPIGDINKYIAAVGKIPILTVDEEIAFATQNKLTGDETAANQLVAAHLRVVISVARSYLGYGLPLCDLIQEGNIGLVKAAKRFDPDVGVRFVTFSLFHVKAEINEYVLRNWRLVKIATTHAQKKLFFNLRSCTTLAGTLKPSEVDAIATQLNVNAADVMTMEQRFAYGELPIDVPLGDAEDGGVAPNEWLACNKYEPTQRISSKRTDKLLTDGLSEALNVLDARSQHIIRSRWLEAEGDECTLAELGRTLGVSAERVRQIEHRAFQKMKATLCQAYYA